MGFVMHVEDVDMGRIREEVLRDLAYGLAKLDISGGTVSAKCVEGDDGHPQMSILIDRLRGQEWGWGRSLPAGWNDWTDSLTLHDLLGPKWLLRRMSPLGVCDAHGHVPTVRTERGYCCTTCQAPVVDVVRSEAE